MNDENYEFDLEKYFSNEIVDLKEHFNENDLSIIKKLNIEIKDKIYTEYEFENLFMEFIDYYKSKDMDNESIKMAKSLKGTGVSRGEYNKLLDKFKKINKIYKF